MPDSHHAPVSIVVVAHDNWPDLEIAISSALQQSHAPLEVLVVDNGSTDGTPEAVAKAFGDRVRYLRQDNRLDAGGYNTGIRHAAGEFIQLLDGDDCLGPNKVEKQLEAFHADPSLGIVYSDARHFLGRPGEARWVERPGQDHPDMLRALCERAGNIANLIPSTALFRRAVFDRVGLFDEEIFSADYDFWFRAASAGVRFRYVPGTLTFYRRWQGQMSRNRARMLRRQEQTFAKALTYVDDPDCRRMLLRVLARGRLVVATDPVAGSLRRSEALARLREARRTSPPDVPLPVYAAAWASITVPGVRRLYLSTRIRTAVKRLLGRVPAAGQGEAP